MPGYLLVKSRPDLRYFKFENNIGIDHKLRIYLKGNCELDFDKCFLIRMHGHWDLSRTGQLSDCTTEKGSGCMEVGLLMSSVHTHST